jgi:G3E family GTPase
MANTPASSRVPVTLISGFLGAGKTTLVNHLITSRPKHRFVVVENEYGDVGIDGSMLSLPSDQLFELNDGCVCCTVQHELVEVLHGLIPRLTEIDHILIETTGLAEPGPVLRIFEQGPLRESLILDAVVTVVDGTHIDASMHEVHACKEQIAYADVLMVNKADLLEPDQLAAVETTLKAINPVASILRTEHSRARPEDVLQVGGRLPAALDHAHHHHHHSHDDEIGCAVVESHGDIDASALDRWLSQLVYRKDQTLLRIKGVLSIPSDPRRFILNGVRDVVDVQPASAWDNDQRFNRIVLIGRHLDAPQLQKQFEACVMS